MKKYDSHNERVKADSRRQRNESAEIGGIPPVENEERRNRCERDLLSFLIEYFPDTTGQSEFSDEQKQAIKRIEQGVLFGNSRQINVFPRGFGKTTISENSALWAVLYGHRRFVPIIGADEAAAKANIESLKVELLSNERLIEDFPEVCWPIAALENKVQRCRSQTHNGEATHIAWSADKIVFASVKDETGQYTKSSGAILIARGITGRLRGMAHKRPDGKKQRPDYAILDDIETDESASSPAQVQKRMALISKAVLRLGGHKELLSVTMNATVIQEGAIADQLLDNKLHPEWDGLRIAMLKTLATAEVDMWLGQYAELRRTYNADDPTSRRKAIEKANQFYLDHQEEMDAGAEATWKTCFGDGEHSAIQHAYNILIDDGEEVFASECQNQPLRLGSTGCAEFLSSLAMQRTRISIDNMPKREIDIVGFHIDVQERCAFYTVMGATSDFTLQPLAYGIFPEQPRGVVPYSQVTSVTFQSINPHAGLELSIELGVAELIDDLCSRTFIREDGVAIEAQQGLVDANFQTEAIMRAIARSKYSNRVLPMFGRSFKAGDMPLMQLKASDGEKRSKDNAVPWRVLPDRSVIGRRNVFNCTNSAKTFLHRRIATPSGDPGSFELMNGDHRVYCDHICESEYPTKTEGPYGEVYEWKPRPQRPDNHLFDTSCGAVVAISLTGRVAFAPTTGPARQKPMRKKVSYL